MSYSRSERLMKQPTLTMQTHRFNYLLGCKTRDSRSLRFDQRDSRSLHHHSFLAWIHFRPHRHRTAIRNVRQSIPIQGLHHPLRRLQHRVRGRQQFRGVNCLPVLRRSHGFMPNNSWDWFDRRHDTR